MIKIISCTKEKNITDLPIFKSYEKLKKLNDTLKLEIFTDNKNGISEMYNKAIEQLEPNIKYVVFVHDDVYIEDLFFFEKLEKGFEKFDLIGVAGSGDVNLSRDKLAWHFSNNHFWSGYVEHPIKSKDENAKTQINYFGQMDRSVVVLDGLFIACKVEVFEKIKFDVTFKFHFYDMDFCLSAITNDLKAGVISLKTKHLSLGEGINSDEYEAGQTRIKNKWKK
jgi:hypothetical protein